ncbi:MAG: hypothetical protein HUU25_13470 [Candidatus Sumerlaeia bacterium]|nr:hypothetical protein [Candidatus Sumerlaeia bacterium]
MMLIDAKEKRYMQEIGRLVSTKTCETLGAPEGGGKRSVDLNEIKKYIDGAAYDEPRVMRALDRMVHGGALAKTGFRWETTPEFAHFLRQLQD